VGTQLLTFGAAFLGSAVESTEALTIVLAVGITRGWRPSLIGAAAGALVLGATVAVLGPALGRIPIADLRLVVGALLLAALDETAIKRAAGGELRIAAKTIRLVDAACE